MHTWEVVRNGELLGTITTPTDCLLKAFRLAEATYGPDSVPFLQHNWTGGSADLDGR